MSARRHRTGSARATRAAAAGRPRNAESTKAEPALPAGAPAHSRRWWPRGLGAVALLIAAICAGWQLWKLPAPPPPDVATDGFDPAITAAIEHERLAVMRAPRSAEARGRMGMVLLAHEVRAAARDCFSQASNLAPRDPRWPYFRGLAQSVDNPIAAVTDLEHAVRLFPDTTTVPRLKLATTLIGLGRLDQAESHYRFVLEREPESAMASLGLGKIANARDHAEEAVDYLLRATDDPATRKAAHRLLLTVYQKLGRTEAAQRVSAKLAGLPNDVALSDTFLAEVEKLKTGEHAWIDLGDEWIKAGRAAAAVPLLEKTIREYPGSVRAMFFLGRARLRLGDARGAETILMRAVELAPDFIEAQMQLGVTRLSLGRPTEAEPCFRAAIQAKPNLAAGWFNLALSLGEGSDRRAESLAAFREAIRLKPDLLEAYLGLAVVLRAQGQHPLAADELRRALSLQPEEPLRGRLLDQLRLVDPP